MQRKYEAKGLGVVAIKLDAKSGNEMKFLSLGSANFPVAFDPMGKGLNVYGINKTADGGAVSCFCLMCA